MRLPVDSSIAEDARPGYAELRYHHLGADPAADELVRERTGDPTKFINGWVSKDGRWLFSAVDHGWTSNDVYFRDLTKHDKTWTAIAEGKDALYQVGTFRDRFYVLTNEGAPKWRLFVPSTPRTPSARSGRRSSPSAPMRRSMERRSSVGRSRSRT